MKLELFNIKEYQVSNKPFQELKGNFSTKSYKIYVNYRKSENNQNCFNCKFKSIKKDFYDRQWNKCEKLIRSNFDVSNKRICNLYQAGD